MLYSTTKLYQLLNTGAIEDEVNAEIQEIIDDRSLGITVLEYRTQNYNKLREWAYPPIADFLDARVKIEDGGAGVAEGQAQLRAYTGRCMAVKLRFPKP